MQAKTRGCKVGDNQEPKQIFDAIVTRNRAINRPFAAADLIVAALTLVQGQFHECFEYGRIWLIGFCDRIQPLASLYFYIFQFVWQD